MTRELGLRIAIGVEGGLPGFLNLDGAVDARTAFGASDGFAWDDREVDRIVAGRMIVELPAAALVRFLLECRRMLRPQGVVRVLLGAGDDDGELRRLAALVGLDEVAAPVAGLPCGDAGARACDFAKRERRADRDPSVSILVPAYSPRFFGACLDSALAQTYANAEIVVCDDSPADAIERLVRERAETREIRYLRNPERLGVRANYRRCFDVADGEFVKFLCDDDLLAPSCVAKLVGAFRAAPDVTLATSHRQRIDADGRPLPEQPATVPIVEADALIAGWTLANAMLMAGLNVVGEPTTALFRKAELLHEAPGYFRFNGTEGHGVIDMVTWTALLLRGDAVYLRESLSSFRIHPGQRQHDPAKARRNVESIRELQYAWLALGLFDRIPRTELLAQPYPPESPGAWQRRTVGTLPTALQFLQAQWTIAPATAARWGT